MDWPTIDWARLLENLLKIAGAYLLVLPVAWERERATRIMGLRTFPLVAVASCAYVLVAVAVVGMATDAHSRIIQGLMTGVGFIGGGAILKEGANVRGTATAASVWSVGALGAAVGYGRWEIAIVLSLVTFLTLRLLTPVVESRRSALDQRAEESDDSAAK
ncbi:MAG: MgtC/SapB family protein [Candidatus Promineofilum sp.]|jgi:putative Mg2+ transporter-C (MgtC) family protein|nr:MgtC/SapB family protein [Promineifilum sp.]